VLAMKSAILDVLFAVLCVVIIAQGALQCFAPRKLKELQDKLRPKGEWSSSAGGAFLERLRAKQAAEPSPLYRFSGLLLLAIGVVVLLAALRFFRR